MFFSIRTTDFNKTRKRGIRFGIALALVCSFLLSSCSAVLPAVSPAVQEQNDGTSLDTVEPQFLSDADADDAWLLLQASDATDGYRAGCSTRALKGMLSSSRRGSRSPSAK